MEKEITMATIKSYTDLSQSKTLSKILPLESADMYWSFTNIKLMDDDYNPNVVQHIPAWSLAALLKLIPNFNMFKRTIECKIETTNHSIDKACDLVDAAFEMVCWLKENNEL